MHHKLFDVYYQSWEQLCVKESHAKACVQNISTEMLSKIRALECSVGLCDSQSFPAQNWIRIFTINLSNQSMHNAVSRERIRINTYCSINNFLYDIINIVIIIRPHRSTTNADATYCYRPSSVVCRSVTLVSPAKTKNSCTDRDAVWVEDSGRPGEPCLDGGQDRPMGRGNFEGERGVPL